MATYEKVYRQSIEDPDGFWAAAGDAVEWTRRWDRVLDSSVPQFYRWFSGGVLNTCDNALDRHIREGRGRQTALVYDSPVTRTIRRYSYEALTREVSRCAGGLSSLGVEKGDRVVIYMPMVPEAIIAMLACARLGAVHSVVFGGFAARELASRLADASPKVIISSSCGIEVNRIIPYKPLLDQAVELAGISPRACVILQRPEQEAPLIEGRDIGWDAFMDAEPAGCVPCRATDPLYILYTSGTTGVPKGVVRDHGGHLAALIWSMKNIYDMKPGETFWAASDIGWHTGAPASCTRENRWGPLIPGRSGELPRSTGLTRFLPRPRRCGRLNGKIPTAGTAKNMICPGYGCSSWPENAVILILSRGRGNS